MGRFYSLEDIDHSYQLSKEQEQFPNISITTRLSSPISLRSLLIQEGTFKIINEDGWWITLEIYQKTLFITAPVDLFTCTEG